MEAQETKNEEDIKDLVNIIEEIEYTYNPFRDNPVKGVFGIIVLVIFSYLASLELQSAITGAILFLAAFMYLSSFYFKSRYRLTKEGVERKILGIKETREWKYFRSYYIGKNGILLSPFRKRSFLEKFKGFELPVTSNNGIILAFIKDKIKNER